MKYFVAVNLQRHVVTFDTKFLLTGKSAFFSRVGLKGHSYEIVRFSESFCIKQNSIHFSTSVKKIKI